jgi:glucose-1-phosphate cytidylyltransferase
VLFCGGLGMRLRDVAESLPKPMVPIGYRPVLWHVMKYYAHYGHKDFILCLGYRGDAIKQYFLSYDECVSNDFVLSDGGRKVDLVNSDISDWRITFADTGATATIGQRLKAAEKYLDGDDVFLANYSDGLTDLPLPRLLDHSRRHDKIANFVSARPNLSYHMVSSGPDGLVNEIKPITEANIRINGGYFVFRREIFDYIRDGEDLVQEPFQRLIRRRQLLAYEHDGFFACLDTFKDKQHLDDLYARGNAPWEVWRAETAPTRKVPAGASASVASIPERLVGVRTA